jgi:hypothetical protein
MARTKEEYDACIAYRPAVIISGTRNNKKGWSFFWQKKESGK